MQFNVVQTDRTITHTSVNYNSAKWIEIAKNDTKNKKRDKHALATCRSASMQCAKSMNREQKQEKKRNKCTGKKMCRVRSFICDRVSIHTHQAIKLYLSIFVKIKLAHFSLCVSFFCISAYFFVSFCSYNTFAFWYRNRCAVFSLRLFFFKRNHSLIRNLFIYFAFSLFIRIQNFHQIIEISSHIVRHKKINCI